MSAAGLAPLSGSYAQTDVHFLLKPLRLSYVDVETKERRIRAGGHYSEMLSREQPPSPAYLHLFHQALTTHGASLAQHIGRLAARLDADAAGRPEIVLASLVRAGVPIGVLLARALRRRGRRCTHYAVSLIRDRGIDREALAYIAHRHAARDIVFVDGWTGKGVMARELRAALADRPYGVAPRLVVIADPAGEADLAATGEDLLIPSGLLNGVVSGLVSRSVLSAEGAERGAFHGCVLLDELRPHDLSRAFVDTTDALGSIDSPPAVWTQADRAARRAACVRLLDHIRAETGVRALNHIKPGLAESARAVLRRATAALYLHPDNDADLAPLRQLAAEKGLPLRPLPGWSAFRAVAVIAEGAEP